MKTWAKNDGIVLLLLLLSPAISFVGAQPPGTNNENQYPNYARFSPSMAIIIVVLIAALFFMGFFSIYIRHCSDSQGAAGSIRRALSLRNRRAAAARGLEPAVIETFPTFSYSEVKDHQIGKGALECAVCLNEFEEDETLRLLPKCDHVFHPECIDAWLESHVTCPVCRANLVPQAADEPAQVPEPATDSETRNPENVEIVIEVDQNESQQQANTGGLNRSSSLQAPTRPPRSFSIRRVVGNGPVKFRSHSTGHSLVQPGENLDRFTLRLTDKKMKEVIDRAALNRSGSCAVPLPRQASSRRGNRTGGGEGSNRGGRFYRRMETDRGEKSDRWDFFTRAFSLRSPKVVAETGEGSGSSAVPGKLPSFKCLEPKTGDETGLISNDSAKSPV